MEENIYIFKNISFASSTELTWKYLCQNRISILHTEYMIIGQGNFMQLERKNKANEIQSLSENHVRVTELVKRLAMRDTNQQSLPIYLPIMLVSQLQNPTFKGKS